MIAVLLSSSKLLDVLIKRHKNVRISSFSERFFTGNNYFTVDIYKTETDQHTENEYKTETETHYWQLTRQKRLTRNIYRPKTDRVYGQRNETDMGQIYLSRPRRTGIVCQTKTETETETY